MDDKLKIQLEILNRSITSEDFIDIAYGVIEEISDNKDAFNAIEPILKLIEKNPDIDFGNPGPLVHFVEQFYRRGYEELLIQSIERNPTSHTLWMFNRIINGSEDKQKEYYLNKLQNVLNSHNKNDEVKTLIKELLLIHSTTT